MNPETVKRFMGQNNSIPLLNTTQSIRSIKTDVSLTQIFPVEAASNMHAFMMWHTTLHLINLQVAEVSCGGNMCDALMMYENGISADKCACYSLAEREAKICLVLDVIFFTRVRMGGRSPSAFTTTPANNSHGYVCLTSKFPLVLSLTI